MSKNGDSQATTLPTPTERVEQQRVLVVDDVEENRDMLCRRLKRKGFTAVSAESGEQALEMLDRERFDLVLLDWMMPGMSGLEVLEKIRHSYGQTDLPVVMTTARSESEDVVQALERGANDYVSKPFDFKVLVARLKTHITVKEEAEAKGPTTIDISDGVEPGTLVDGRYELLDKLGEGGFAAVYRARQTSTEQLVAFKFLLPHRVRRRKGDTELVRFLREMRVIGTLDHPNIVRLIDSGQIDVVDDASRKKLTGSDSHETDPTVIEGKSGPRQRAPHSRPPEDRTRAVPYIVMEYLDGETLANVIKRETEMAPERIVDVLLPVLSALALAHEQGVVHRDMKPHNIFLVKNHRGVMEPKVLDFGIAKLTEAADFDVTKSDSFIGTPEYMAPEQGRGHRDIDGRADQFSVGAIAYQALTGRKLYKKQASFFAMVHKVAAAEIEPPSSIGVELPPGLESVLLRALAKEREDRFADAEAFGRALLPFASMRMQRRWADAFNVDLGEIGWSSVPPDSQAANAQTSDAPTIDEVALGEHDTEKMTAVTEPTVTPPLKASYDTLDSGAVDHPKAPPVEVNIEGDDDIDGEADTEQLAPVREATLQEGGSSSRAAIFVIAIIVVAAITAYLLM